MKSELYGLLGVNAQAINFLVAEGYFPLVKARHPKSRKAMKIVPFSAMDEFLETYVSCRQLAMKSGVNTLSLAQKLDEISIKPVTMPFGCKGRIYLKEDLTAHW